MSERGRAFTIAWTGDFNDAEGKPRYADIGLSVLEGQPHIRRTAFADHRKEIAPDQLAGANGVIVLTPAVTAASVSKADDLLAIGRFGVGYETVDLDACTKADVLVFIAAGAVDRSVAEAAVGWMIALTHHVRTKDQLLREGRWDERTKFFGRELRDRTFGAIGLGGIAKETIRLLSVFGMNPPMAFDPFVTHEQAKQIGVRLATLDEVMEQADFVSVHCPLTPQTRGLIGPKQIGRMKHEAYLINTARGGIVDEDALFDALSTGKIAGAALDCFDGEPITSPHRFGKLDNVLLAPHSIAWTHELFRDIGRTVCRGMIDVSQGNRPKGVVNPAVLERANFQKKWQRFTAAL